MANETFLLVVVASDGREERKQLAARTTVIGRDPECHIHLHDITVSRRHAAIEAENGRFHLIDLGSANGTILNGRPLAPRTPVELREGDEVAIGSYRLTLRRAGVAGQAAPSPAAVVAAVPPSPPAASPPRAGGMPPSPPPPSAGREAPAVAREMTSLGVGYQPPRLIVLAHGSSREYPIPPTGLTIGRDPANAVTIDDPQVSRRHAEIRHVPGGYEIVDLGSTYGIFQNGQRVGRKLLVDNDALQISDGVRLVYRAGAALPPPPSPATIQIEFGSREVITIGRDPSNDIPLNHPQVSRFHARLTRRGAEVLLTDLGSTNGTFVNGQLIATVPLRESDHFQIGPYEFTVSGGLVAAVSNEGNIRVDAVNISRTVRGNKVILQPLSLSFKPRELVAIVGASGSGKTTLLNALSGFRPATQGRVLYNGQDLYRRFEVFRNSIGFVPQDDIIHRELPVIETLRYAAQLRLPRDTTVAEREQRIAEVLADLGLDEQRHNRVDELSGGQRKRVSMGVELLTRPSLFFLDEPTSGLDPATETRMMQLLRRLADQGRTILLITHATQNIKLCDKVVFMARGGYLAFFGTPAEALEFFGVQEFADIYDIMQGEETRGLIASRYAASPYYHEHLGSLSREIQEAAGHAAAAARPESRKKGISSLRQLWILTARTIAVTRANRKALAIVLFQAPIIALLVAIVFPRSIFNDRPVYIPPERVFAAGLQPDPTKPLPNCGLTQAQIDELPQLLRDPKMKEGCGNAMRVMMLLFFIVLVFIWFGTSNASKEIVKELPIYKRERMIGVRVVPYLFSKFIPLLGIALIQNVVFLAIMMVILPFPFTGPQMFLQFFAMLYLVSTAAILFGLFVSSLVSSVDESNSIVPILLIPQVVFAGAVIPLAKMPAFTQPIANFVISRWGWESAGNIFGVVKLAEKQGGPTYQMLLEQEWLRSFEISLRTHTLVLLAFCLVFLLASYLALRRKDTV
ncbi:MAG: FHA domain-containing protein [Chloroflexota bacterium]|nr:FHA domain-containing protein [Dehalococcoidia bacterium]MDW8253776.1 FHA domain-containing protein [Chloroflexota bacterium]